jgi:hypothetical protein
MFEEQVGTGSEDRREPRRAAYAALSFLITATTQFSHSSVVDAPVAASIATTS